MVNADDFEKYELSQFYLNCDLTAIPIIDLLLIDNNVWGRPDIVLNKYYPNQLFLIPLLLEFNNINDISEMRIGEQLKIPDFDFYMNNLIIIDFLSDNAVNDMPGVLPNVDNAVVNNLKQQSTGNNLTTKTLANSKLGIELSQSKIYNNETGILTF